MANSKSNYLEAAFLSKVLKNVDFTVAGVYVALFTSKPDEDDADGVEVAGNAYARQQVAAANWSDPTDDGAGAMESHNTVDIVFPQATPAGWGTVVGFGLYSAATGGNQLYVDDLAASKTVDALDQVKIPAGSLVVKEA